MGLEGPPVPPTPRTDRRKFYDMVAEGVLGKAVERISSKLSDKLLEAFKHGRSEGRREGAAVAFGLMGMFEAIRRSKSYVTTCERHDLPIDHYIGAGLTVCASCYASMALPRHSDGDP